MMFALVFICSALQMLVVAAQQPGGQYFIIAPNLVRVDVDETILVTVSNIPDGEPVEFTLYFQLTEGGQRISQLTRHVEKDSPHEFKLKVTRDQLPEQNTKGNQFVTLVASANSDLLRFEERQAILLSYRAGFVFIQTDKPLYNPSQTVYIRVIALDQTMAPVDHKVQVDIMDPAGIIVHRHDDVPQEGFLSHSFVFPSFPVFGNWSVVAYYGHKFKVNTSVQFEVKEYVLPGFNVIVQPQDNYILPETTELHTHLTAKYTHGARVDGRYLIKYGVYTDDGNLTNLQEKPSKRLNDQDVDYDLVDMQTVFRTVAPFESLVGKRLVIQAFVIDKATGETVNVNNTKVVFSRTPYKFNWENTHRYFKRALPFVVKARVQFKNGHPASNVPVAVSATATLMDGTVVDLEGASGAEGLGPLNMNSGQDGQVDFRLDVPETADQIDIHLKTARADLIDGNARSDITVAAQESNSEGEYLLVHFPAISNSQVLQIGSLSNIDVQLTRPERVNSLHYFVIAGGSIVHKGVKHIVNTNTALAFQISHKMAPSSRIVAYYVNSDGYVIADALQINVEKKCENPVTLSFEGLDNEDDTYKTDGIERNVRLRVGANEYTGVGLIAVDEAIFALRNYHRLTQKKVFERMAGYDLGCGPGGGQTSASVFKDAGVTVITGSNLNVPQREDAGCAMVVKRSRRQATDASEKFNKYQRVERTYCEMGLRKVKDPEVFPCARRVIRLAKLHSLNLTSPEMKAFYDCCLEELGRGRASDVSDEVDQVDLDEVVVRSYFPESWIFAQVNTGDNSFAFHDDTLPDSVTTWVVEAVGVSEGVNMCVASPIKLQVRPLFFLELSMPYSVQRFEQIEIVVSIHNYADVILQVEVSLKGAEAMCSRAQAGDYSRPVHVTVHPGKPALVKFVVVPLKAGNMPIEVVAVTNSSGHYRDGIKKKIAVRPEGYRKKDVVTITVDPENTRGFRQNYEVGGQNQSFEVFQIQGEEGENRQVDIINYAVQNDWIPDTHEVHISMMGNIMGSVIETVLRGLDSLLNIPTGCGEQTMISLAPNVYVYRYLKYSDQFTVSLESKSKQYVGDGVGRELLHRRADGSFSVWGDNKNYPSSTWLTAFVSKVFCQAREFAYVDPHITCSSMEWLIDANRRNLDGSFREIYRVHHTAMTGGVQGHASLTAFVLISLLECSCQKVNKTESVTEATSFLELEFPALTRPFDIAITAYALALANSMKADEAMTKLKSIAIDSEGSRLRHWGHDDSSFGAGPKPYWYSNQPSAIQVETTSYALLAFLQMENVPYSHAIVNWLTNQENYEGGFVSTQDTVIALQALSEYAIKAQFNNVNINCHVFVQDGNYEKHFNLRPDNALVKQHAAVDIPDSPEFQLRFDSQGEGMGQLKFESSYNLPEPPNSEDCAFSLTLNGAEGKSGGDSDNGQQNEGDDRSKVAGDSRSRVGRARRQIDPTEGSTTIEPSSISGRGRAAGSGNEFMFNYTITVGLLRGERTGMAIVDVGLFTGYQPIIQDLKYLKERSQGAIPRYEVSDRSVIFYLKSISREETTISFKAKRVHHVGKIQPVPVRVYDFYNPTLQCTKFLHPDANAGMLGTICEGETCICAAGVCATNPASQSSKLNKNDLTSSACQTSSHFAYEVSVQERKMQGAFYVYKMTIITPLKQGLDPVSGGESRYFLKSSSCNAPNLSKKKNYLVIGSKVIPYKMDENHTSYKYIIDEKMAFYVWPKSNKKKFQDTTRIFNNLRDDLVENGCST